MQILMILLISTHFCSKILITRYYAFRSSLTSSGTDGDALSTERHHWLTFKNRPSLFDRLAPGFVNCHFVRWKILICLNLRDLDS